MKSITKARSRIRQEHNVRNRLGIGDEVIIGSKFSCSVGSRQTRCRRNTRRDFRFARAENEEMLSLYAGKIGVVCNTVHPVTVTTCGNDASVAGAISSVICPCLGVDDVVGDAVQVRVVKIDTIRYHCHSNSTAARLPGDARSISRAGPGLDMRAVQVEARSARIQVFGRFPIPRT